MTTDNKYKLNVVCFGGADWWYHNRGHIDMQIMRRYAKEGKVLYVNSIVVQKPKILPGKQFIQKLSRKLKSVFRGMQKSQAGFWVVSPFSLPVHHIVWMKWFNELILHFQIRLMIHKLGIKKPIVWLACPAATDIAVKMKKYKLIYQRADRWEEFPNVDSALVKHHDHKAKANADLTIFVSSLLFNEEAVQCKSPFFLDHGVDYDLFAYAERDLFMPKDIRGIKQPLVGFFGGIDSHTFDIPFLEKVVDLVPDMSFVLIGNSSVDCAGLLSKSNVLMLGQKPYEQIPHYGKYFDVLIMPWCQNEWIKACNPIKLKEYLALGKPVVSTPFPELQKYCNVVYQASSPKKFAQCIRQALAEDSSQRISERRKKVETCTWDRKAELVLSELYRK